MDYKHQSPANLLGVLRQAAKRYSEKGITTLGQCPQGEKFLTYHELFLKAASHALDLTAKGFVSVGKVTLLYFEDQDEQILWTWSTIAAGAIPVILSPLSNNSTTAESQKQNINDLFKASTLLTRQKYAHNFSDLDSIRVEYVCKSLVEYGCQLTLDIILPGDGVSGEAAAAILQTSGSTGKAKGVVLRHNQLLSSIMAKHLVHDVNSDTNFLAWMSFDHSANFCELHLNAMVAGANLYQMAPRQIAENPSNFWHALSDYRIGYTLVPNSVLGRANQLLEQSENKPRLDLSSLQLVAVGGEANYLSTLVHANQIATLYGSPPDTVKAAYGLTETCSACFYTTGTAEDIRCNRLFSSAGKPLPSVVQIRIVDKEKRTLNFGKEGGIQLRGDAIFQNYYNNPAANEQCMTDDDWFDTGDEGRLDEDGSLQVVGRKKELLIINGNNYSTCELEHTIIRETNGLVDPTYIASFGVLQRSSGSEAPVILFAAPDKSDAGQGSGKAAITAIEMACVSHLMQAPADVICLPRCKMPKSTLGKLSRATLKEQYLAGLFNDHKLRRDETTPRTQITTVTAKMIARILSDILGIPVEDLFMETSFTSSGLDSLGFLKLRAGIEKSLVTGEQIPMPVLLGSRTIADLEKCLLDVSVELCNEYSPLITFQTSGSKTPLFLVHPGGGDVWNWINLVKYLPDRPIYAFRLRGLPPFTELFASHEEMLDTYEAAVIAQRRHGPYAFLGHCFGGTIAFELAKRFEARGESVVFCGGIDQPPQLTIQIGNEDFKLFMLRLVAMLGAVSLEKSAELQHTYAHLNVSPRDFVRRLWDDMGDSTFKALGLTFEKFDTWCRVFERSCDMARAYRASGRVSNYHSFWVNTSDFHTGTEWESMIRRWDLYADNTTYTRVEGTHFNILVEPQVNVFQEKLNRVLGALNI